MIANELFIIAERINNKKYFRFAEQLRAAGLSISNNIAEGSGSFSDKDFANYLVIARKSIFECANMLIIFERMNLVDKEVRENIFDRLFILSSQITNFRKTVLMQKSK